MVSVYKAPFSKEVRLSAGLTYIAVFSYPHSIHPVDNLSTNREYNSAMQWIKHLCLFGLSFGIVLCTACYVNADEVVSFATEPLWLSQTRVTEGKTVQVSTVVRKGESERAQGTVTFMAGETQIGTADFSLSNDVGGAVVGISWVPTPGKHKLSARISSVTYERNGKSETITTLKPITALETLTVEPDNDRDGTPDPVDADDDNDGIPDATEIKNGTDPKKKEEAALPTQVAGVATSTGDIVGDAQRMAQDTGNKVFQASERLREKGKAYFDTQIAKQGTVSGFASSTNAEIMSNPAGVLATAKSYALKAGSFVFGNVYAFYIFVIVFVLWVLRTIWRRYSLN